MGGGRSNSGSSSSSSGEEDGDAEWRAAIDSVSGPTPTITFTKHNEIDGQNGENTKPPQIKLYQITAQKMLDEMLEKNIELVMDTNDIVVEEEPAVSDCGGGVRLFKRAPVGIVFDHVDELRGPKKKPKILPGEVIDEKSKKFKKQLQSVAVDGAAIIAAAGAASENARAKLEAREAAFKAATKKEEERVVKLKKIRGERWLPSIAREMRVNTQRRR